MPAVWYNVKGELGTLRFFRDALGPFLGDMRKKVGDTVACLKGCRLEEGEDVTREVQTKPTYATGIVICLQPFVIESRDGQHRWYGKNPDHYFKVQDIHKDVEGRSRPVPQEA